MSYCPVIEIFPTSKPYFTTGDDRVILDIDAGTSISLNKTLKVENDVYAIGSVEDIVVTIPNTAKNFFYLKNYFDPATDKPNGIHVVARISLGSETLFHNRLYCVSKNKQSVEVRLNYEADWKKQLEVLKIKDLDLGIITITQPYIESNWENNSLYNNGDVGHWFPLVYYGGWRVEDRIVIEDLRPLFHTLFIIQKMFEHIGWCIEIPFYETTLGRRCIDYILRKDYNNIEGLRAKRRFSASHNFGGIIFFTGEPLGGWTENSDFGNRFDPVEGIYKGSFEGAFIVTIQMSCSISMPNVKLRLIRRKINQPHFPQFTEEILHEWSFTQGASTDTVEIPITVLPNEEIYFELDFEPGQLGFIDLPCNVTINFTNRVDATFPARGDTIALAKLVDQDLTCYDYLLGCIHFMSGIVDEQPQYKKVRILTPFNAVIFGESIEGYFQNTLVNLRSDQPIQTTNSAVRNEDQLRFILIAFAKTTDELNKRLQEDNQEFFSKTIDLGEPYISDIEEFRNPLFEYTLLVPVNHFISGFELSNGIPDYYHIPQMSDNDEGHVSTDIQPRKIIAHGYDLQFEGMRGSIVWERYVINKIAFAAQDATGIQFGAGNIEPELKLIYGEKTFDLWSMVLARFFMQIRQRLQLDLLNYMTHEKFFRFNQRNIFEIEYDGHPVVGRVLSVNDYQPCNVISAQMILMPELISSAAVCVDSDDPDPCTNRPVIIISFADNCWTFSIGGTFDSVIESITWYIQRAIDPPETWTEVGTDSTVIICDEIDWFIIRADIVYADDCLDETITEYIEPCTQQIKCKLGWIIFNSVAYISYRLIGDDPSVLCEFNLTLNIYDNDTDELLETYNSDSSGSFGHPEQLNGWTPITPLVPDSRHVLTGIVDCENGCPDLELECTWIDNPPEPPPQETCNNVPELICVPVTIDGVQCYTFALQNAGDYQYYIVSWECDNGLSGQWMPNDPPICECNGILTSSAMVHYCDCPPVCTPYIECDASGCVVVSAGTPLFYLACN